MFFKLSVELATHDFGESVDKGVIDASGFYKEFDNFPWSEQVAEAQRLQKVSPTLSVYNGKGDILWVSAMPSDSGVEYLMGSVEERERSFLGLIRWKSKKHRSPDAGTAVEVKAHFQKFFAGAPLSNI